MPKKIRAGKKIRRFTEDVLSKEIKASIQEMAKTITQDISRKTLAATRRHF